jgi:hypothetical protein
MDKSIRVIIEAMPSDIWLIILTCISGVLVPIILLIVTIYLTKASENRAMNYAKQIRESDRRKEFLHDVRIVFNDIYKCVLMLRHNNLRIKEHEDFHQYVWKDKEGKHCSSTDAISIEQDLLRWQMDHLLECKSEHASLIIELEAVKVRLENLLTESFTAKLGDIIEKVVKLSAKKEGFTDELVKEFVSELNEISREVEKNPEKWLT